MEKIREKTKKVSVGWDNAILHYFDVYTNFGIVVGKGYVVSYPDGYMSTPELVDFSGERLPSDWYQMKMTDYKPCIVPKRHQ